MSTEIIVATTILFSHVLGMIAEFRLHRRNLAVLEAHGGKPRARPLMLALYGTWALAVPFAVRGILFSHSDPERLWVATGLAAIGASQLLRRWAEDALGPYWTMAIIELPGMRALNSGPYRLLKNPEYISRFTELCGIAVATGAYQSSGIAMAAMSALMLIARVKESAVLASLGNLAREAPIE